MRNGQNSVSMGVLKSVLTHIVLQPGNGPLEPIDMHVMGVRGIHRGHETGVGLVQDQRVV